MTVDLDDNHNEIDDICGWEAVDFDDELRSVANQSKSDAKQRLKKTSIDSSSNSRLPALLKSRLQDEVAGVTREQQFDKAPRNQRQEHKRKVSQHAGDHHDEMVSKPPPRASSLTGDNAVIAAVGRQRRMKVVAAALAANITRKAGMASVVSASFDTDINDEHVEAQNVPERRSIIWPSSAPEMPSPAPQKHVLRVYESSTSPVGDIEVSKRIQPTLPLPLLSIKPDCSGIETRLPANSVLAPQAPRHYRRRSRQQPVSLLPTRDVSEHWETNFPPVARRLQEMQQPKPNESENAAPSCTSVAQVHLLPEQECVTAQRAKELLPSIRHTKPEIMSGPIKESLKSHGIKHNDDEARRSCGDVANEDDESWTLSYNDPEMLAKSMAGLIQSLSTFAAGGKPFKPAKGGQNRKRRAKLPQQHVQASKSLNPIPPQIGVAAQEQEYSGYRTRRRKHRKLHRNHANY